MLEVLVPVCVVASNVQQGRWAGLSYDALESRNNLKIRHVKILASARMCEAMPHLVVACASWKMRCLRHSPFEYFILLIMAQLIFAVSLVDKAFAGLMITQCCFVAGSVIFRNLRRRD